MAIFDIVAYSAESAVYLELPFVKCQFKGIFHKTHLQSKNSTYTNTYKVKMKEY